MAVLALAAPAPALAKEGPGVELIAQGAGFSKPGGSEQVADVQRKLNRLGYAAGEVDGLYGPVTGAAVRRFQQAAGLAADGIVGPRTQRALDRRAKNGYLRQGAGYPEQGGSSRVRGLQRALNESGFRAGEVDGKFGPRTEAAVRRFQQDSRLAADGIVGPRTRAALRQVAKPAKAGNPSQPADASGSRAGGAVPSSQGGGPAEDEGLATWWLVTLAAVAFAGALLLVAMALGALPRRKQARAARMQAVTANGGAPAGSNGPAPVPLSRAERENHGTHVWRTQLVDVPYAARLLGVGARAQLVNGHKLDSRFRRVYVELSLFAEGTRGRWETELLDDGAPFAVDIDDLEDSIEAIVVPDRLEQLAATLRRDGIDLGAHDLEVLPFMLERSDELERLVIQRRFARVGDAVRH
jgi:peptidoglycan hydrolase-like protein with peptidoglycan-binding domain